MIRTLAGLALATVFVGCGTGFKRAPGAPELPPSPHAEVMKVEPPAGSQLLGTVEAYITAIQAPSVCDQKLANEARKLGANAVVTMPVENTIRGPKCTGKAYLIPK